MLLNESGKPIGGSPDDSNKGPRTVQDLRSMVENGELGGQVFAEGKAAEELEQNRKILIRAREICAVHLQKGAHAILVAATQKQNADEVLELTDMARCLRKCAYWLAQPLDSTNGN